MCAAIIDMFHVIPAASHKMLEPLTSLTLKGEKDLLIEVRKLVTLVVKDGICHFVKWQIIQGVFIYLNIQII